MSRPGRAAANAARARMEETKTVVIDDSDGEDEEDGSSEGSEELEEEKTEGEEAQVKDGVASEEVEEGNDEVEEERMRDDVVRGVERKTGLLEDEGVEKMGEGSSKSYEKVQLRGNCSERLREYCGERSGKRDCGDEELRWDACRKVVGNEVRREKERQNQVGASRWCQVWEVWLKGRGRKWKIRK